MFRILISVVGLMLLSAVSISAQLPGAIRGQVTDQNGAILPGATLTLSGAQLQGRKTAIADAEGNFVFLGLAPGDYKVEVRQSGFQDAAQENIGLRAGQTLTLDLKLTVGGLAQSVNVAARGGGENVPIIDTSNPEMAFNVSGEFINKLPLSSRQNWESVWFLVPGAVTIGTNGPDGVNFDPVINGASQRSNAYRLDGFEIGNSFTNQGWTTQFSTEAIQDVQIKAAGADASTPLGQGGFINIVTKSGGNKYSGSAAVFLQPRRFNWTNVPGGTPADQSLYQPDLSFGGPIKKDRLWFFMTYRRVFLNQGVARSATVLESFRANGFNIPDYDLQERNNRFTGKLTYRLNDKNTVSFNYLNDHGLTLNSDSRDYSTQESTIDVHTGGPTYQVNWTSTLTPRLLLTSQFGYRRIISDVDMKGGENPAVTRYSATVVSGGNLTGATGAIILQYGNRAFGFATGSVGVRDHYDFTTDLSYAKSGWLGQHTFGTGFQVKPRTRIDSQNVHPSSGLGLIEEVRRVAADGTVSYAPFHRQYRNPTEYTSIAGITRQVGFYFQDKWQAHPRLTVNVGARFDRQTSVDSFQIRRVNTWSADPRFGVAWSASKNGRDVIRVSWGRYHDIIYVQAAPSFGSRAPEIRNEWDNNLDGTYETVRITPAIGLDGRINVTNRTVDPNLHASFEDSFNVSYTRQLPWKLVFDGGYVDNRIKEPIGLLDTNIIYENGLFRGYKDVTQNAISASANLTNSYLRYQSMQFSLIRNIGGRYSIFTNYTWQRQKQAGDFASDDPAGYVNPRGWFETDKLARPHIFRVNGHVYLPWRFTTAAIFSLHSGNFGGPLTKTLAANDPEVTRFGPASLTLSNGRVVNNPLSTTTRLVGPRGERQLQLPALPRLNLRLGKEFKFKETQTFEAGVDFFNITNNGAPLFFRNGTNTSVPATFGQYLSNTQAPRGAQMSLRWRF